MTMVIQTIETEKIENKFQLAKLMTLLQSFQNTWQPKPSITLDMHFGMVEFLSLGLGQNINLND